VWFPPSTLDGIIQATHRFRTSTLLEVAVFAISLVLILSLVHDAGDGLTALLSLLVTSVIVTLMAYVIVVPRIGTQTARFRSALLIRESSPLFLVNGMPTLMTSASTYLLTLFLLIMLKLVLTQLSLMNSMASK